MGACMSSGSGPKPPSPLDLTLARKLREYCDRNPGVHAVKSLQTFAMKFPAMLRAFEDIRVVFERVDADKNGTIEYPEFLAACAELEVKDVDDDILRDIYAEADVDGRGSVDFRSFLVSLACIYLMTDPPSDEESSEARRLVHVALDKVLEAWLFFDRKNAGVLRKSEVTEALVSFEADSKGHEGVSATLIRARFEEMDWDRSQQVSFQEFLHAVEGWVGLGEDEDE